jgi:hypothetical protein
VEEAEVEVVEVVEAWEDRSNVVPTATGQC